MSGTAIDQIASDQRIPFVRYSPNWMKPARATTSAAKRILPAREFGVVLGSEIMKKAKRSSAPLSIRCSGTGQRWRTYAARPNCRRAKEIRNAYVTSLLAARFTTRPPRQAIRKPNVATLPHCPGETQTGAPRSIRKTSPKLVGLKMCFPWIRTTNLLAMVTTAAKTAIAG